MFFRFVTKHTCVGHTGGRTDRDRDSIAASRGKNPRLLHISAVLEFLKERIGHKLLYFTCNVLTIPQPIRI